MSRHHVRQPAHCLGRWAGVPAMQDIGTLHPLRIGAHVGVDGEMLVGAGAGRADPSQHVMDASARMDPDHEAAPWWAPRRGRADRDEALRVVLHVDTCRRSGAQASSAGGLGSGTVSGS